MTLKKTFKGSTVLLLVFTLVAGLMATPAFALSDGPYVVKRTASYADPATGKPVDDGDLDLGNEMCNDIIEDTVLIEQVHGRTFVTVGLNLASQIADATFEVQDSSGNYVPTEATQTGSKTLDDDTRVYMRFETFGVDSLIRPTLDVIPMGREVTCFVTLDGSSAKAGTGQYTAELVTADGQPTAAFEALPTSTLAKDATKADDAEEVEENVSDDVAAVADDASSGNPTLWIIIGVAAVVIVGVGAFAFSRSKKKGVVPVAEQAGSLLSKEEKASSEKNSADDTKN